MQDTYDEGYDMGYDVGYAMAITDVITRLKDIRDGNRWGYNMEIYEIIDLLEKEYQ